MLDLAKRAHVVWMGTALVLVGCKEGSPPVLDDPGDQIAVVGQELRVALSASDPDGGTLTFSFRSTLEDINAHAQMTRTPDGQGLFTYTPVAAHEGPHIFDFVVSDGDFNTTQPITIDVRGASGAESAPVFREPKTGLVFEAGTDCVDIPSLDVIVEDLDTVEIELTQAAPVLPGADLSLEPGSLGKVARWKWCPRPEDQQVFQHQLRLSANDGENPPTIKEVPIVIRPGSGAGCPGGTPTIDHTPESVDTLQDVAIVADFADDVGISAPVVYYTTEDPGSGAVDFSQLEIANMTLDQGDAMASTWRALIPNPVAEGVEGDSATLYYIIEVVDTDDPEGGCNHRANSPRDGFHSTTVTHPGTSRGGAGLCEACSFDVQCGDAGDLCIQLSAGTFCASACNDGCPDGYACSENPVTSIDGAAAIQCVPTDGVCGGGGDSCEGDEFDPDDDTPESANEVSISGDYDDQLVICPGNQDWFALEINEPTVLFIDIDGETPPDVDLELLDNAQQSIASSETFTSTESIESPCLEPTASGEYYYALVEIYEGEVSTPYSIEIDYNTEACVSDCCETSIVPECTNNTVRDCVCNLDSDCCEFEWDSLCVSTAINQCSLECE